MSWCDSYGHKIELLDRANRERQEERRMPTPEPMTRETLMDFIETVCEKWYEAGTSEQVWDELKAQLPAKIDALLAAERAKCAGICDQAHDDHRGADFAAKQIRSLK